MTIKEEAFKLINEYRNKLSEFDCSHISEKPYNYEFEVKDLSDKLKIQVYFGKKGIKTVFQGNKKSNLYSNVEQILTGMDNLFGHDETNFEEPHEYIGTDETGKGDFFGPLVVAAAAVNKNEIELLRKIGVKDSKTISDRSIFELSEQIKLILKDKFIVKVVKPVEYNSLYEKFNNLNMLLDYLHSSVIEELLGKCNYDIIITDKFMKNPISLYKKFPDKEFIQETSGERYIGVAAASILARDALNLWFEHEKVKELGLLKGASNKVLEVGKEIFSLYGSDFFKRIAKLHFKTLKKIIDN